MSPPRMIVHSLTHWHLIHFCNNVLVCSTVFICCAIFQAFLEAKQVLKTPELWSRWNGEQPSTLNYEFIRLIENLQCREAKTPWDGNGGANMKREKVTRWHCELKTSPLIPQSRTWEPSTDVTGIPEDIKPLLTFQSSSFLPHHHASRMHLLPIVFPHPFRRQALCMLGVYLLPPTSTSTAFEWYIEEPSCLISRSVCFIKYDPTYLC